MKGSIKVLACAGALACGSAFAQTQAPESAFYLGGSLGQSKAKDMCGGFGGFSCDDKDTAWKIFGGYEFNRWIAAEGAYTNLGKFKATSGGSSAEVQPKAWEAVAIGSYPIGTSGFAPYIKGGFYRAKTELSSNFGSSASETNTDWTAGIGVRYLLSPRYRTIVRTDLAVGRGSFGINLGIGEAF